MRADLVSLSGLPDATCGAVTVMRATPTKKQAKKFLFPNSLTMCPDIRAPLLKLRVENPCSRKTFIF